jgi:hypothetical protein
MGQDRCGSARILDTHRPGAFAMAPFAVEHTAAVANPPEGTPASTAARDGCSVASVAVAPALRRFRHPLPIRVQLDGTRPARVSADRTGIPAGRVDMAAGPWRSSGDWWAVTASGSEPRMGQPGAQAGEAAARTQAWNRDEWDVALDDGTLCRIYRDRDGRGWFMEGCWD